MLNDLKAIEVLKEHPTRPGFHQLPRYPLLYINKDQVIIDSREDIELMPYVGYYDYLKVDVTGLAGGILVHRAMAETFLDPGGQEPRSYQVNHKDGNKLNNTLKNLEFVTRAQNSVHAFKIGCRTDNRPVLCKDLRTGEVKKYYGMADCDRHIGAVVGYVSNYLKGTRLRPALGVYEVILEGEDWKGYPKGFVKAMPETQIRDIVCYDEAEKVARIYRGMKHASVKTGFKLDAIQKAVENGDEIGGYRFTYLSVFLAEMAKYKTERVPYPKTQRGRKPPRPIRVYDHDTNHTSRWISTERFARHHGVDKKTIQKSMNVKDGRWCNFTITYE